MHHYIVTVTAADRVGIVSNVSGTLGGEGGNIIELSQTVLRGYFTLILEVQFEAPRAPDELSALVAGKGKGFGLNVAVIEAKGASPGPPVPNGERFILTVLGEDAVGNVHGIAERLAGHGVNIVDLHARADGPRFLLVMEAFLPPDLAPGDVRADLEKFGRAHGLEAFVQHENIFQATTVPSPVRVGPTHKIQGDAVVPH